MSEDCCVKCGTDMDIPFGMELTDYCNTCAQELVPELLEALKAVLLFHSGSPWDDAKRGEWQRLGLSLLGEPKFRDYHYAHGSMKPTSFEATTRVLCDMVRAAITKTTKGNP